MIRKLSTSVSSFSLTFDSISSRDDSVSLSRLFVFDILDFTNYFILKDLKNIRLISKSFLSCSWPLLLKNIKFVFTIDNLFDSDVLKEKREFVNLALDQLLTGRYNPKSMTGIVEIIISKMYFGVEKSSLLHIIKRWLVHSNQKCVLFNFLTLK